MMCIVAHLFYIVKDWDLLGCEGSFFVGSAATPLPAVGEEAAKPEVSLKRSCASHPPRTPAMGRFSAVMF